MATNSPVPQIQLDELPTPQAAPVEFARQPEPQPDQANAGWAGKGGQVANIAANFLHGWMQGRDVAAQREMDQAKQKLHSSFSAYQMAMSTASNPDLPPEQRDAAAKMIPGLKGSYLDQVRAYSGKPAKGAKDSEGKDVPGAGEGQGFMHRLAKAFVSGKPEMFASGMADMLRGSMPEAPPALSPQQQGARAAGTAQVATSNAATAGANVSTAKAGQEQKVIDLQNQMAATQQKMDHLKNDPNANPNEVKAYQADLDSMNAQIARYHGATPAPAGSEQLVASQVAFSQRTLDLQKQGLDQLKTGVDPYALPGDVKMAMGLTKPGQDPVVDSYFSQVGPNRMFKTSYDAGQALMKDRRAAMLYGRPPTSAVLIENNTAATLQHDLQNPDIAAKYGVAPLQENEDVREKYPWIVAEESNKRLKAEQDEKVKPRTVEERDRLRSYAIQSVLQKNPDLKDVLSFSDAKGTHYGINPSFGPTGSLNPFGDNAKDANAKVLAAKAAVVGELRNLDVADPDIKAMGFEIPQPLVNIPAPPKPMSAPPQSKSTSSVVPPPPAGAAEWEVTYPNGSKKTVKMTMDEVSGFLDKNKGSNYTFNPVGQQPNTMSATPAEKSKQ